MAMRQKKTPEEKRAENLKYIKELCLMDDILMTKCFEGNTEVTTPR